MINACHARSYLVPRSACRGQVHPLILRSSTPPPQALQLLSPHSRAQSHSQPSILSTVSSQPDRQQTKGRAAASLRLSPGLKELINLPEARGAPVPAPPEATLSALFDGIRTRGEEGGIGWQTWVCVLTAALVAINSPDAVCALYDYSSAQSHDLDEQVEMAAAMREVGLKAISFVGPPKVINNLNALRDHLPEEIVSRLHTTPLREPTTVQGMYSTGRGTWDAIYEPHAVKLINKLGDAHPDLPVHILHCHYGHLLTDPSIATPNGAFLLRRILTSVIAIAGLRAQTGVGPQVTSHVFGLKKSLLPGGGFDGHSLHGQDWLVSDDGVTWILQSVDEIGAVMRGEK